VRHDPLIFQQSEQEGTWLGLSKLTVALSSRIAEHSPDGIVYSARSGFRKATGQKKNLVGQSIHRQPETAQFATARLGPFPSAEEEVGGRK